jgi:CHASE3 domain sensor protein
MTAPELQQEIERTRQQLGQTVQELAAKADLKARAKDKAAELRERARERALGARGKARERALGARGKARDTVSQARTTAFQARDKTRARAAQLSGQVRQSQAVQRRWPLAVAAGVLAAGSVAAAWWLRRKQSAR